MYTEPARFLRLLLDEETGRSLNTMLLAKCPNDTRYISIEDIVDTLDDLLSSRKALSTRRKEFFGKYNVPNLMGPKGNKIDGFVAGLSRDVASCKLEAFSWTDYQIFICINTLKTSDKDEAKLAEKLTKMYNVHSEAKTTMTLASVQSEVKRFWSEKKETEELMYNGSGKPRSGQSANPEIKNNGRRRRSRKRGKSNSKPGELVAAVSGDDKNKEQYCFKCGEPDHTVTKCTKKESELKCKAHPDSNSHTDLASISSPDLVLEAPGTPQGVQNPQ